MADETRKTAAPAAAPAAASDAVDARPETAAEALERVDTTPITAVDPTSDTPDQPKASSLKQADAEPGPFNGDAEGNDPPVRTNRPDVPIIERLAVGAGQHTPNDSDVHDAQGRFIGPSR